MAYIRRSPIWPDPRVKPPFGAAEIDWGHPLAFGLEYCWLFNEGGGKTARDLVGRAPGTIVVSTTALNTPGILGACLTSTSATSAMPVTLPAGLREMSVKSWACRARSTVSDASYHAFCSFDVVTPRRFYCKFGTTFYYHTTDLGCTAAVVNVVHDWGYTTSASRRQPYLEGQPDGGDTTASEAITLAGLLGDPYNQSFKGEVGHQYFWSRVLSANEMLWVAKEPYAMLRPIVRRRYFDINAISGVKARPSLALLGVGS